MKIGDRVKFKTIGGWYNSGIIKDMDEDSYLIEVDELGCKPPEDVYIPLPYYARVLSCEEIVEQEENIIDEESEKMTNEEAAIKMLKSFVEVRKKYGDMQTMKDEIECLDMGVKALTAISELSKSLKAVNRYDMDEKVLIGFNMAVAIFNKCFGEVGEKMEVEE